MQNVIFEDMVKVMERGQVTIPLKLREIFNLQKGFRLWIRVNHDRKIVLEPVKEDKAKKLSDFLKQMAKDQNIYWTKEDDKRRTKIRRLSTQRLKKLLW